MLFVFVVIVIRCGVFDDVLLISFDSIELMFVDLIIFIIVEFFRLIVVLN